MRTSALLRGTLPLLLTALAAAAAPETREIRKTVPLDPDGRVEIKTFKGSVTVTTGTAREVEITARIEPDGTGHEQDERVRETRVKVTGSGSHVRIESDYGDVHDQGFGHWLLHMGESVTLPFVRYTVRMPASARLEIEDFKSKIEVSDLSGELRLQTYKGEAKLDRLAGRVRVQTYKGSIHADLARVEGPGSFQTYKGSIVLALPRDAAFTVDAHAGRRGLVESDFPLAASARSGRHGSSERTEVNGGGPRLELSTYKGSFELRRR